MNPRSLTFFFREEHLVEVRFPLDDHFYSYWGKPMYGGVFGAGEYALVGYINPLFTIPTVNYIVMHIRSGFPLTGLAHETKAGAIGFARDLLKGCDRNTLYASISGLIVTAAELEQRIAAEEKRRRDEIAAQRAADRQSRPPRDRRGNVYLIRCDERYKIGKAVDVESRLRSMMLPSKPEIIATGLFDRPYDVERELHRQFKHCRENGEWFRLSTEDVELVANRLRNAPELQRAKLASVRSA